MRPGLFFVTDVTLCQLSGHMYAQSNAPMRYSFHSASAWHTCAHSSAPLTHSVHRSGIVGILGSTYTGEYEDVKKMDSELEKVSAAAVPSVQRLLLLCPCHAVLLQRESCRA